MCLLLRLRKKEILNTALPLMYFFSSTFMYFKSLVTTVLELLLLCHTVVLRFHSQKHNELNIAFRRVNLQTKSLRMNLKSII